jgi:hypothetical protein
LQITTSKGNPSNSLSCRRELQAEQKVKIIKIKIKIKITKATQKPSLAPASRPDSLEASGWRLVTYSPPSNQAGIQKSLNVTADRPVLYG